jgi:predicted RNA binding protein YcfA (HicA-like mRNA interferase family)
LRPNGYLRQVEFCAKIILKGANIVKVRSAIKMIEADGWYLVATRGSHRQYRHSIKPGRVTIAGNLNHDLSPGTLNSILKQAQLKEKN